MDLPHRHQLYVLSVGIASCGYVNTCSLRTDTMRFLNNTFVQVDLEGALVEDRTVLLLQNGRLLILEQVTGNCFGRVHRFCAGTVACLHGSNALKSGGDLSWLWGMPTLSNQDAPRFRLSIIDILTLIYFCSLYLS